jgi:hypothetical protein
VRHRQDVDLADSGPLGQTATEVVRRQVQDPESLDRSVEFGPAGAREPDIRRRRNRRWTLGTDVVERLDEVDAQCVAVQECRPLPAGRRVGSDPAEQAPGSDAVLTIISRSDDGHGVSALGVERGRPQDHDASPPVEGDRDGFGLSECVVRRLAQRDPAVGPDFDDHRAAGDQPGQRRGPPCESRHCGRPLPAATSTDRVIEHPVYRGAVPRLLGVGLDLTVLPPPGAGLLAAERYGRVRAYRGCCYQAHPSRGDGLRSSCWPGWRGNLAGNDVENRESAST